MRQTTFSVVIPTHDRRETVVLAVKSALRQSRAPLEVIVVCDGCSDGTAEALRALGDERVIPLELEKGPGYGYAHRNDAVRQARGDVVVWLGDDDLFLPNHLKSIGRVWDRGDVDLVVAPAIWLHEDDRIAWWGRDWSIPAHRRTVMERFNTSPMSALSTRTSLTLEVGGWNGELAREADWDLWKRLLDAGARPAMTSEATALHPGATGRTQAWPDRVKQNKAWLKRIGDRSQRRALRESFREARSVFEAELVQEYDDLHAIWEVAADTNDRAAAQIARDADEIVRLRELVVAERGLVEVERDAARDAHAASESALHATRIQRDAARIERDRARAEAISLRRELTTAQGDLAAADDRTRELTEVADARQRTLDRIYGGSSWRLTRPLRGLKSLVRLSAPD